MAIINFYRGPARKTRDKLCITQSQSRATFVNNGGIILCDDYERRIRFYTCKSWGYQQIDSKDRISPFSAAAAFCVLQALTHECFLPVTKREIARSASDGRHYAKSGCRNKGVKEAKLP